MEEMFYQLLQQLIELTEQGGLDRRHGGPKTPCRSLKTPCNWPYRAGICMAATSLIGRLMYSAQMLTDFPLTEPQIIGEQNQKQFISLFGAILRMRNLLSSFDEFQGNEKLSDYDLQNYLGRYQDLRDEWRDKQKHEGKDITDDIVFEVELIRQIEINIDYILMLVKKYHDGLEMTMYKPSYPMLTSQTTLC